VRLFRDVARRLPRAKLYGSDGIAESGFTERLRPRVARRMVVTVSTLAPSDYPAHGQDVLRRYGERYRGAYADPYALYGYEAMRLFLDAVAAGGRSRAAVVNTLHGMGDRDGVVGRYSFDRFGDTTQRTYGLYRISRGLLQYAGAVTAR
jgi:branched-chain amino acid transport system substrate-binding protein